MDESAPILGNNARSSAVGLRPEVVQGVVCLALFIEFADYAAFGAIGKVLEEELGVHPGDLSKIFMYEKIALAISYPVWGTLADRTQKFQLLAFVAAVWAACSLAMPFAGTYSNLVAIRLVCGVCGGCVGPLSQVMVAATLTTEGRGKAFGALFFCSTLGGLLGTSASISTQHMRGPFGLHGWQCIFIVLSGICGLLSALVAWLAQWEIAPSAHEPRIPFTETFTAILSTPSIVVIILQGIFRNAVVMSLQFVGMWVQYLGFSDGVASLVVAAKACGLLAGSLFAGIASDWIAGRLPDHGRIMFGQTGDVVRSVAATFVFFSAPMLISNNSDASGAILLSGTLFFLGFSQPWAYVGALRPLLSEVVPKRIIGNTFAVCKFFEDVCAALLVGPMIGFATRAFGYRDDDSTSAEGRAANAAALGNALLYIVNSCHAAMFLALSLLYVHYVRDRNKISERPETSAKQQKN